ncbi:LuxR C-terminal-related transcriptional regulator [Halosquirtibacter laminarini]|uniref:LuxR C-terminal-related transcriptional regulator n=1 Tax=Halosquirtibacter laminarini TaxID=3374600 RepID=A0AC61NHE6_9BACT|nr:LuxR C-terminal-related transcriptional regulator [Prolixibacteraceae bacterium]
MRRTLLIQIIFWTFLLKTSLGMATVVGIPETSFFSKTDYQGGTQNWAISQDSRDLLWIGNNKGVIRYDGENWDLISDFKIPLVRAVQSIGDRIYIAGFESLGFYETKDASHQYHALELPKQVGAIENIWGIFSFKDQVIFHSEKAILIYENDQLSCSIPAFTRFKRAFNVDGKLFVFDEAKGLFYLQGTKLVKLPHQMLLEDNKVTSMLAFPNNQILIGTHKSGCFLWSSQGITAWKGSANTRLIQNNIFCATLFSKGLIAFGTIQGGLIVTNLDGDVVTVVDKDRGLKNNTVLSLFVDRQKNIWCGLDNGIAKVNLNNPISFISSYYNIGTGYDITKSGDSFYLATNQALFKVDRDLLLGASVSKENFKKVKGTEGQNWSVYNVQNGVLVAHDLGVFYVNGSGAKLITPKEVVGVWKILPISGHPNLLLGGTYKGLIVLRKIGRRWRFSHRIEGLNKSLNNLVWDKDNCLWVTGGEDGILKLHFDSTFTTFTRIDTIQNRQFAKTDHPLNLFQEKGEVKTYNHLGIFMIDTKHLTVGRDTHLERYFEQRQFPTKIRNDKSGNLWIFKERGVSVLRRLEDGSRKRIVFPFVPINNRLVDFFGNVYTTPDAKHTFINIVDGFAHYNASQSFHFDYKYRLNITAFEMVDPINNIRTHKKVKQAVSCASDYPYRKNNAFRLRYAATDFNDSNIQYNVVMLRDGDTISNILTDKSVRNFENLSDGHYTVSIGSVNRYGVQADQVTFSFNIAPPWYRNDIAKVVYLLLFLLLFSVMYIVLSKKQKHAYGAIMKQYEEDIRQKEHDFNQEKLRQEMSFKEKELSNLIKHIAQKNDFLQEIHQRLNHIAHIKELSTRNRKISQLQKQIDKDMHNELHWVNFNNEFEQIHHSFIVKLTEIYPDLTEKEQKLAAYIKLGIASKEIAVLMNITPRTVENYRYKLRQRFGLKSGESLSNYIIHI